MARSMGIKAEDIDRAERRSRAVALRRRGWYYREIAKELGVSLVQAKRDVDKVLEESRSKYREHGEAMIELELGRLDDLSREAWKIIEDEASTARSKNQAMRTVVAVSERRSKLLGLDAPEKRDVTSAGEPIIKQDYEVRKKIEELHERFMGEAAE